MTQEIGKACLAILLIATWVHTCACPSGLPYRPPLSHPLSCLPSLDGHIKTETNQSISAYHTKRRNIHHKQALRDMKQWLTFVCACGTVASPADAHIKNMVSACVPIAHTRGTAQQHGSAGSDTSSAGAPRFGVVHKHSQFAPTHTSAAVFSCTNCHSLLPARSSHHSET